MLMLKVNILFKQLKVFLNVKLNNDFSVCLLQIGETIDKDCDERCVCEKMGWTCKARCTGSQIIKRGDPFENSGKCREKIIDECCAAVICDEKPKEGKSTGFFVEQKLQEHTFPNLDFLGKVNLNNPRFSGVSIFIFFSLILTTFQRRGVAEEREVAA